MEESILSVSQGYISIDWINRIHCTMLCFKRLNRSYQLHKAVFQAIESIISVTQGCVSSDWIDHISCTRLCFKRLNRSCWVCFAQGCVSSDWIDHINCTRLCFKRLNRSYWKCVHFPVLGYISAHWVLRVSQRNFMLSRTENGFFMQVVQFGCGILYCTWIF